MHRKNKEGGTGGYSDHLTLEDKWAALQYVPVAEKLELARTRRAAAQEKSDKLMAAFEKKHAHWKEAESSDDFLAELRRNYDRRLEQSHGPEVGHTLDEYWVTAGHEGRKKTAADLFDKYVANQQIITRLEDKIKLLEESAALKDLPCPHMSTSPGCREAAASRGSHPTRTAGPAHEPHHPEFYETLRVIGASAPRSRKPGTAHRGGKRRTRRRSAKTKRNKKKTRRHSGGTLTRLKPIRQEIDIGLASNKRLQGEIDLLYKKLLDGRQMYTKFATEEGSRDHRAQILTPAKRKQIYADISERKAFMDRQRQRIEQLQGLADGEKEKEVAFITKSLGDRAPVKGREPAAIDTVVQEMRSQRARIKKAPKPADEWPGQYKEPAPEQLEEMRAWLQANKQRGRERVKRETREKKKRERDTRRKWGDMTWEQRTAKMRDPDHSSIYDEVVSGLNKPVVFDPTLRYASDQRVTKPTDREDSEVAKARREGATFGSLGPPDERQETSLDAIMHSSS